MNLFKFFTKLLVTILVVLCILIGCKKSHTFKEVLYKNVYDNTMSLPYLNDIYNKYLGHILPFKLDIGLTKVFKEELKYNRLEPYLDGIKLDVDHNYLVPAITSGLVIFIGEKESLGNTIIILDSDGVEAWYSNINPKINLYDYIDKGTYIGDADSKLYLTFKKDGQILNYEKYIS